VLRPNSGVTGRQDAARKRGPCWAMERFVSRYEHPVDAKGRVSLPGPFRQILLADGLDHMMVHPSLGSASLDCGGKALTDAIESVTGGLAFYSAERDELALALSGDSEMVRVDKDGRFVVTDRMRETLGDMERIAFVGLGYKFQMWRPADLDASLKAARERVRQRLLSQQGGAA
jgi:MraZ protein